MLLTTNSLVTNLIPMIAMLTGIGCLLAWILPTHCLHSLEKRPPFHRAFRQCVGYVQAMMISLPGRLLAFLVPTDCLRSLENWPPFHRAFRQSVGNPEAVCSFYDKGQQQPDGNYALEQIAMATSKGPGAGKIMNDAAYECTRENVPGSGRAGNAASVQRSARPGHKIFTIQMNLVGYVDGHRV